MSPFCPKGPRHVSTEHPSKVPLPLRSSSHVRILGSKTPIFACPVPFQSPATGRSPEIPKGPRQPSTVHLFSAPLPLRSSFHRHVLGVKMPSFIVPVPVQSPTTGLPWRLPKDQQPSVLQLSMVPV